MCLTVPVIAPPGVTSITPVPDAMKLVGMHPDLMYGFHGSTTSKQPFLSGALQEADSKGRISNGLDVFYMVDITCRAPDSYDDKLLYGQLPLEKLGKVPFLVGRRLSTDAAAELGKLWYKWAKAVARARDIPVNDLDHWAQPLFGPRKGPKTEVNWDQPLSYMLAYPELAAKVFEEFPKTRCLLMPMRTKLMPAGRDICWVGVIPKAKASKVEADVRLKSDIRVDLKFSEE
jgi:hypothetical protein